MIKQFLLSVVCALFAGLQANGQGDAATDTVEIDFRGHWVPQNRWVAEAERTNCVVCQDTEEGMLFGINEMARRSLWTLYLPGLMPVGAAPRLMVEATAWGMPPDGQGMVVGLVVDVAGRIRVVPAIVQEEMAEEGRSHTISVDLRDVAAAGRVRGLAVQLRTQRHGFETQAVRLARVRLQGFVPETQSSCERLGFLLLNSDGRGRPGIRAVPTVGRGQFGESDADGRIVVETFPTPATLWEGRLAGPGMAEMYLNLFPGTSRDTLSLRAMGGMGVGGTVRDEGGNPVAMAAVHLWAWTDGGVPGVSLREDFSAFTGNDGTWSVAGIPECVMGVWIQAAHPQKGTAEVYCEGSDVEISMLRDRAFEMALTHAPEEMASADFGLLREKRLAAENRLEAPQERMAAMRQLSEQGAYIPAFQEYALHVILNAVLAEPDAQTSSLLADELFRVACPLAGHPAQLASFLTEKFTDGRMPDALARRIGEHQRAWHQIVDQSQASWRKGLPAPIAVPELAEGRSAIDPLWPSQSPRGEATGGAEARRAPVAVAIPKPVFVGTSDPSREDPPAIRTVAPSTIAPAQR